MNRIALFSSLLFAGALVFACAGNDGSSSEPADQTDQQGEDLKSKRCGAFLHGACPTGYWCDMSSVAPGAVGGSGVCKKEHKCILNGVFVCPPGETFDASVCHCR